MPFEKGNKFGGQKPVGSTHARTKFLNALKGESKTEEEFIQRIVELAIEGNTTCLNICATRLWKEPKATYPTFVLPESESKVVTCVFR